MVSSNFFPPFSLWTFHLFLLCCFILFPAPKGMPDQGSIIGSPLCMVCILCLIGILSIFTLKGFYPFLHLLPIASMHIITRTIRVLQTLFLNFKPACLTFPTVCFESSLISTNQKLNCCFYFTCFLFSLPLAFFK